MLFIRKTTWLVFLVVFVALLAYASYYGVLFLRYKHNGEVLARSAVAYEQAGQDKSFGIFGDSLAYGVGASSDRTSFAGLLGEAYPGAQIDNYSLIGADVSDLNTQLQLAKDMNYDAVFIFIGGNDIMRYGIDIDASAQTLQKVMQSNQDVSRNIYMYTYVNFRNVEALPWFVKSFYADRSEKLNSAVRSIASNLDTVTVVDLASIDAQAFKSMQASDGFHLNDDGYRELFKNTPRITD